MKFLHFYEALRSVCGPCNEPLHAPSKRNEPSKVNTSLLKTKDGSEHSKNGRAKLSKQIFKVESGFVHYKPIDSTARRVTSPASWIHKPNAIMPQEKIDSGPSGPNDGRLYVTGTDKPLPKLQVDPKTGKKGYDPVAIAELRADVEKGKALEKVKSIELQIAEARSSVLGIVTDLDVSIDQLEVSSKKATDSIRAIRMSAISETNQILAPLKEIRKFFHGSEHLVEMERLKEFVDLCERLQALKRNGTLDAISDTMIKLIH